MQWGELDMPVIEVPGKRLHARYILFLQGMLIYAVHAGSASTVTYSA